MICLDLFYRLLKGTLPWQPIFGKIFELTFIRHAGFSKRIRTSQYDLRMLNGNTLATFCTNMVKIGPVTPEITRVAWGMAVRHCGDQ